MIRLIRKSTIPFGTLVVAVLFLITMAFFAISGVTHAYSGSDSQPGRLITIHDRGTEKVIISEATTIGDALIEANIVIDSKDAVEPAISEKLIASDYQVNIYRARPIVIVDGNTRIKTVTPYQTAVQIAQSAGIILFDEDLAILERADDIISEGVGLKLTINRATQFVFTLYGKTATVRSQGATVGEMLFEKGIILGDDDRVSINQDTKLSEGLAVRVWREGKQTATADEEIDFEIEKIEDADREINYKEVKTTGEKGSRSVTYEITVQDGQEVNRVEIASITTKQPIKQVELIGIKGKYTTPSENETITWDFLIKNGFTRQQTAGIMGNLMQEHKFNTFDTSGGYGIAQWMGGRRSALLSRPNSDNIYVQLNFLMDELNSGYASVRDEIRSSDSLENAVVIFQNKFERCGLCMESLRVQYARNILASH